MPLKNQNKSAIIHYIKKYKLAVFIRENSLCGHNGFIAFPDDKGKSFKGLRELPIKGMHRPFAGFLSDRRILLSYREHLSSDLPYRDLKMCIFEEDDLFKLDRITPEKYLIDSNGSPFADQGYSAWFRFRITDCLWQIILLTMHRKRIYAEILLI